jgi:hypothetical protein
LVLAARIQFPASALNNNELKTIGTTTPGHYGYAEHLHAPSSMPHDAHRLHPLDSLWCAVVAVVVLTNSGGGAAEVVVAEVGVLVVVVTAVEVFVAVVPRSGGGNINSSGDG